MLYRSMSVDERTDDHAPRAVLLGVLCADGDEDDADDTEDCGHDHVDEVVLGLVHAAVATCEPDVDLVRRPARVEHCCETGRHDASL